MDDFDERRVDVETRQRLDDIAEQYKKDHADNSKKLKTLGRILYALILISICSSIAAAYLINDNRGRADRINKSRAVNLYNNCRDQNRRNEGTKIVLDKVIKKQIKLGKITQKGGEASKKFTILLIDALAPHRDCTKLVLDQIKELPRSNAQVIGIGAGYLEP